MASNEHLERLIVDTKESLEREMREGFAGVNTRLDNLAARLERHGGLLDSGGRSMAKIIAWAEKIDSAMALKDQEIAELRARIRKLEERGAA